LTGRNISAVARPWLNDSQLGQTTTFQTFPLWCCKLVTIESTSGVSW